MDTIEGFTREEELEILSLLFFDETGELAMTHLNLLRNLKRAYEEGVYDDHTTGQAVWCVPLKYADRDNLDEYEIQVPDYYYNKMLLEGKLSISKDQAHIIADFYYDSEIGPVFSEELVEEFKVHLSKKEADKK